jgi:hypothetical protein
MTAILARIQNRLAQRDDAGIAMVVTVSVMMLMTLIPMVVVNQAVQQLPIARRGQDHESALHAAEAGVDDYLNHLNNNNNYWLYTTTAASPDANQAFSTWVPVPGPATNESFRYSVENTNTASNGIATLTSSGKAGNVVRTIRVGIRKLGFLDYLYLTDYEIVDPSLSGEDPDRCQVHAWEKNKLTSGYGPDISNCSVIFWTSSSTLNGPTHTNDGLYVCGNPVFNGNLDTYYNSATTSSVTGTSKFGGPGTWLNPNSCTNKPVFSRNNDPIPGAFLGLPPGNKTIQNQANATTGPGCLYTGPTTIAFHYSGDTGFMDVTSPATKQTKPGCGPGTNLSLPSNGVIFVQGVPGKGDPNYSACSGSACYGDVSISNGATSGGLAGQLTVAAENDIVITGSLTYHTYPTGTDVLGLIATNDVALYHPVTSGGSNGSGSVTNPRIDAAILSLNHSFYVQNWNRGSPLGTLTVNGVIAQKFRGPVGTFSGSGGTINTGYAKAYSYDTRLKYLTPPYFLNPLQSAWVRLSFGELKPAF